MMTFNEEIRKHTNKWAAKKETFFKKYNSALAKSGLVKQSDINDFWNKNYKPKFDTMLKKMNSEYATIYKKHHTSK